MDPTKFLLDMAKYYKTIPAKEQEKFVQRLQQNISDAKPLLIEADGGIGKTIGYLVCGMRESLRKNMPLLIATSTITNRDQIKEEYEKIVEFAKKQGDPIAAIPFFNFRSVRDYASRRRLEEVIARLEHTHAPAIVLDELYEIRERLNEGNTLLDTVMPYDITYGDKTVVQRREIAAHPTPTEIDDLHDSFVETDKQIREHDEACVIVMTQAMLHNYRRFYKSITAGKVAMVVIDEVDKLTSMDFVTFTSLTMNDIEEALKQAAKVIEVHEAREIFGRLQAITKEIMSANRNEKNVILIHSKIGEHRTKTVHAVLSDMALCLDDLAEKLGDLIENMDATPITDWSAETVYRRLLYAFEELAGSADQICRFVRPHSRDEWMINTTDLEVFFSWDEKEEFRVAAARPGGLMEWLFRDTISVPVVLTTAFLGEPERWFANKIGLPMYRLNKSSAIRAQNYGRLKFVYFTNLHDAIHENPKTGIREPNPEHFDDIERMIRTSPWSWEPGKRLLVLTPGYFDIHEIQKRLSDRGFNGPIFPHLRDTNINELRDKLVRSNEGGILLTVYWEGFNIVAHHHSNRRGLIDVMLMSRIPFQRPNRMLEALHSHLGWSRHLVIRDLRIEAKRRIHQGFNRVVRGPMDEGSVLICDNRFPPPDVLTDKHDEISARAGYIGLLDAIPDRFRFDENCFELVDFSTMEKIGE